jgi:hypothetical protein
MYPAIFNKHDKNSIVPPNQSLKLTEIAVSFSPRAKKFLRERRRLPRV